MRTEQLKGIERALIIKQPHIGSILDNRKCWEMRSTDTKTRGWIALIEQGTGLIIGKCFLFQTKKLDNDSLRTEQSKKYHCLDYSTGKYDKWSWAWVIGRMERFDKPIPYKHPQGAVIWVKSEAWQ